MKKLVCLGLGLNLGLATSLFGWGEVGHQIVAKTAAEILKNQPQIKELSKNPGEKQALEDFLQLFLNKNMQAGHVANIPDTYWRELDNGSKEEGNLLGDPTHYFNSEVVLKSLKPTEYFKTRIPLDYEVAKTTFATQSPKFFTEVGSLPWRAQQFSTLYALELRAYPKENCKTAPAEASSRLATTFAGLLAHFVADASLPLHTTVDSSAIAMGQKGLRHYFDTDLVNQLELSGLYTKVYALASQLLQHPGTIEGVPTVENLRTKAKELYPDANLEQEVTALMFALIGNSYTQIEALRQLDYNYSLATLEESLQIPACQKLSVVEQLKKQVDSIENEAKRKLFSKVKILSEPGEFQDQSKQNACRRHPAARVDAEGELAVTGKSVAEWSEPLIVARLALAAALTADIWAREWMRSPRPALCQTALYAHKPSFVSPTDTNCAGYALKENPKDFLKSSGGSALPWKGNARSLGKCLSF